MLKKFPIIHIYNSTNFYLLKKKKKNDQPIIHFSTRSIELNLVHDTSKFTFNVYCAELGIIDSKEKEKNKTTNPLSAAAKDGCIESGTHHKCIN